MNKEKFKEHMLSHLHSEFAKGFENASEYEFYQSLSRTVMEMMTPNWERTREKYREGRQVHYFSAEFLVGRSLENNLINLGILEPVIELVEEMGHDFYNLLEEEQDPGLGNGGLGRLAACFMDSGASLNYPLNGNCIRYKSGLFKQYINHDGEQVEVPDYWMKYGNPWEIRKPKHAVEVNFYGQIETSYDHNGNMHFQHINPIRVVAVPYDMAMIGANTKTTNTLRLWSAEPSEESGTANTRDYLSLVDDITEKLYPDDSTDEGKYLRLMQEYFFVSAGVNSIVRSYLKQNPSLKNLGKKVCIQMNDTHPVLVIPELLRVLMDEYSFSWDDAWDIVKETVSYTNHTVMAEALEKWPVNIMANLLPRIYMIIQETDRRFVQWLSDRCGNDHDMIQRLRIIKENNVHMANLAVIGSHHVNGVAEIHTEILKKDLFRDFYHLFPERFTNKTNGITPRRWMFYNNPQLRELLDKKIGTSYQSNYKDFEMLMDFVDAKSTQEEFIKIKHERKGILANYILRNIGVHVDPDSIFDVQAKRLHAYKRQLLNIMQIIYRYERIKEDPNYRMPKHTYIFAAKAASSYTFAKKVIKLINNVANVVNNDPNVKDMIKIVFLPNYNVSMAEVLVPGTDISEQISTAGKEASGTGCMKFMMNGAVTIGTMDGANVEIDRRVGRENDVIFGLRVADIDRIKYSYRAKEYYDNDLRIRKVMDTFTDAVWSNDPDDFRLIYNELMTKNDEFFVLADFDAYIRAQEQIEELYLDCHQWAKMCLVNIAKSGYFSSDRTIEQYVKDIWKVKKLKV